MNTQPSIDVRPDGDRPSDTHPDAERPPAHPQVRRRGRPRIFDFSKQREVCALIGAGAGLRQAARSVRCDPSSILREADRNSEFQKMLDDARLSAAARPLVALQQAAKSDWRAAAWLLERTQPSRFQRQGRYAFGPAHARALVDEVRNILRREIRDLHLSERIERRVEAAISFATRQAWASNRSRYNLRRAMEFFEAQERQRENSDPVNQLLASLGAQRFQPARPAPTAAETQGD